MKVIIQLHLEPRFRARKAMYSTRTRLHGVVLNYEYLINYLSNRLAKKLTTFFRINWECLEFPKLI